MNKIKNILLTISPPQILAFSFLAIIIIGTLLLKLPISTTASLSWLDALFTAASATTVTGLIVVDTATEFTRIGQTFIMIMIQLGGIGLMTFALFTLLVIGRKITLKQRLFLSDSLNQTHPGGIIRLVKLMMIFIFVVEASAFFVLAIVWVPTYGWSDGLFHSIFHTISAFNNAGFSTWTNNLMDHVTDPIVNIVITFLFIIGGLGFTVIADLKSHRRWQTLSLHTKLTLVGALILNVVSIFVIFFIEYNNPNTIGTLSEGNKLLTSYFQAVAPRTAGFNTIDIGSMEDASLLYIIMLMFIGGGTGSTASGVKLTTIIVVILATYAFLTSKAEPVIFRRSIPIEIITRSLSIISLGIIVVFSFTFLLTITEEAPFLSILFETVSAFGTVGLSTGITGSLSTIGRLLIILLMFIGRLGPLTMAFLLARPHKTHIRYPKGNIFTG
ncbi:ktr system potassium uptake protein B [Paraliobacillus ryukyuensis]|uniref:Trk system potassium uptake protein TrkH n=1 Tax=Paraliobacillus ryukyuensis TaxID=200904 RepID=A0A366DWR8_9BACI|nr:TrkH family potassium uptake protein [Paraliobacillus ryukyuensis]RBO94536.1 trk system potassium uptake protein TrkH [Paraliobacillus ryukyuensis]